MAMRRFTDWLPISSGIRIIRWAGLVEALEESEAEADVRSAQWEIIEQRGGIRAVSPARECSHRSADVSWTEGVFVSDSWGVIVSTVESGGVTAVVGRWTGKLLRSRGVGDWVPGGQQRLDCEVTTAWMAAVDSFR